MINRNPVRRPKKVTDCKPITLSSTEFISLKRKKLTIYRILYFIGGNISLAFGIMGIFLPGLPTTPFVLLAAALYAKSSPKLYNWLLNHKFFGPRIRNYREKQGITKKGKIRIIVMMSSMVLLSSIVFIPAPALKIMVLAAGVTGSLVVWFIVPDAKED